MILYRSALCALALFVVMPAEARIRNIVIRQVNSNNFLLRLADDGTASAVTAAIESDAGSEDVTLVESDAWLHGAATIKALPKTEATLTLTLYDGSSASLMSFSGTLGTDGAVTLVADKATLDIEVLAGEVFTATGGYDVAFDLAGADTYDVAYASISVTESKTTTKSEVGFDAVGAIWEGDLTLNHEGVVETKVKTYDSAGKKLDSAKAKLGVSWLDGGEGINVLATDEDPLTTVGILGRRIDVLPSGEVQWVASSMVVNSEGWTSTTVPVSAKVELTNGSTITIPANSYQRAGRPSWAKTGGIAVLSGLVSGSSITVTSGSLTLYDSSEFEVGEPDCSSGTCVTILETEAGDYELAVSEYGIDATKLADKLALTVTSYDKSGVKESSESVTVTFDADITAVFANEVSFSEDPLNLDLSGKVSLLAAADKKGKQSTLAKGKFYGSFSRDGDGELNLAGADKDAVSSSGNIVVAGSAVAFELTTDTNKDGELNGPPVTPLFGTEGARVVRVRGARERKENQQKR